MELNASQHEFSKLTCSKRWKSKGSNKCEVYGKAKGLRITRIRAHMTQSWVQAQFR